MLFFNAFILNCCRYFTIDGKFRKTRHDSAAQLQADIMTLQGMDQTPDVTNLLVQLQYAFLEIPDGLITLDS